MKKKVFAVLLAATMLMSSLTVSATKLTNIVPGGSTAVEADIEAADEGEVSYIIAIPEKIDFGTLVMPEDDTVVHPKTVGFEVSAVEINNLNVATSRVAILLKDAVAEVGKFQITGVSGTNNNKVLSYAVLNSAGVDVTNGTAYPNGYAFAAFSQAGQAVNGSLSLEQNQLLTDKEIANWAGDYLGTINFYTAIADISSYN